MGKLRTSLIKIKGRPKAAENAQPREETPRPRVPVHSFTDKTKSVHPFRAGSRVLVVGDGNFGYSRSLKEIFGADIELTATCHDSEQELYAKYKDAAENVAALREGACVLFGVDCCKMATSRPLQPAKRFTRIVFNFPHCGLGIKDKFQNVRENQKMLDGFFRNALLLLAPRAAANVPYSTNSIEGNPKQTTEELLEQLRGRFQSSGVAAVEEEPEVHVTLKAGDPYDLWGIRDIAKSNGFRAKEAFDFLFEKYPAYRHRRTIGDLRSASGPDDAVDEIVEGKRCKTFVFVPLAK